MSTEEPKKLAFVNEIRKQMDQRNLMLAYKGEMSQDIVIAMLHLTEKKLHQDDSTGTLKSKVFSVMVECLQNITQHSEKIEHGRSNIFMIGQDKNGYLIFSGNVIRSEQVEELEKKLVNINSMTEEQLKEFYKHWIRIETLPNKTGIGLGLIQIARKTGNPLDFDFKDLGNGNSFFSLRTLIKQ